MPHNVETSSIDNTILVHYILILSVFFIFYFVLSIIVLNIANIFLKTNIKRKKLLMGSFILGVCSSINFPITLFIQNHVEAYLRIYEHNNITFILIFAIISIISSCVTVRYAYGKNLSKAWSIALIIVLFLIINSACGVVMFGNITI